MTSNHLLRLNAIKMEKMDDPQNESEGNLDKLRKVKLNNSMKIMHLFLKNKVH